VDLSDNLAPPRRALFFPVVIATVFLSIIGMSAGLVLGAQRKDADRAAQQAQQQQQQQQPITPADPGTSAPETPRGPACRAETPKMAAEFGATGTLRVALHIQTKTSSVWICADNDGRYYYHANRGGPDGPWIERETALFLAGVRRDGDEYLATASDGATFSVTTERLFIVHADGDEETQPAVR
jgi:hypothetical protein